MNIVGFVGSPHPNGDTAWAVNTILDGAKEKGATVRTFCAGSMQINPCQGCGGCIKTGGCVVRDDMQPVYAALKTADALVMGAPIYMAQMSGQAKAFTDRLYAQFSPRFSPHFKEENAGKKLILAWTQGNPDAEKFRSYLEYTREMFALLEFAVVETVVVAGTRTQPACDRDPLPLREIGARLTMNQ